MSASGYNVRGVRGPVVALVCNCKLIANKVARVSGWKLICHAIIMTATIPSISRSSDNYAHLSSLELTGNRLNREQHGLKLPHSAARHRLRHLSLSLVSLVLVLLVTIVRAEHRRRHPAARGIPVPAIVRAILSRRYFLPEEILHNRTLHLPRRGSRDPRDHLVGILRAPSLPLDASRRSCRVIRAL